MHKQTEMRAWFPIRQGYWNRHHRSQLQSVSELLKAIYWLIWSVAYWEAPDCYVESELTTADRTHHIQAGAAWGVQMPTRMERILL